MGGGKDGGKGKGKGFKGGDKGGKGGKSGGGGKGYGGGGGKGGPPTKVPCGKPSPLSAKAKEYIPPFNFTESAPRLSRGKDTKEEADKIKEVLQKMLNQIPKPQPGPVATKEAVTNTVELNFEKEHSIYYQYDVKLSPSISSRHKFKETVKQILRDTHGDKLDIVVSGDIVYSNTKVKDQTYNWKHTGDNFYKKIAGTNPFKMDVKLTREVSNTEITQEGRTVISNIVKEALDKNPDFQKIGRTMFHFKSAVNIPGMKKQVVPGLHITLIPASVASGFVLQLDVTNKVVSTETAFEELDLGNPKKVNKGLSALVSDLVMMTVYDNKDKKKRTVHIDGADISKNEDTKLDELDGRSLRQYFGDTYSLKMPKEHQPLLYSLTQRRNKETGAKEEVKEYYLPSVLRITGIAPKINGLSLKSKVNELCAVKPNIRFKKIMDLAKTFFSEFKPLGKKWGLDVPPKLLTVPTMSAPLPTIVMSNGYEKTAENWRLDIDKRPQNPNPTTGCFNNNYPMQTVCAVIPKSCMGVWNDVKRILNNALNHFNYKNKVIIREEIVSDFSSSAVAEVCTKVGSKADCYFFLTDRTDEQAYNAVKKYTAKDGVPSQVARAGNLSGSKTKSVMNNIAAQMLVKGGNALWAKKGCDKKGVMVVGISQHHAGDGAGRGKESSVMGFCSTKDSKMTQYNMSRVVLQPGEAIAKKLEEPMKDALNAYKDTSGAPPKELVFFREGGSEGEVPLILLEEIAVIEKALSSLKVKAKITFFLVIRNSHLRIANHTEGSIEASGVPGCGTVISSAITSPVGMEFYLLSQVANIGSPCAVKYKCLRCDDEKDLKELKYPSLANDLASLYYNWQGPIATPSVCKYADADAKISGEALVEKGAMCSLPKKSKAKLPFL